MGGEEPTTVLVQAAGGWRGQGYCGMRMVSDRLSDVPDTSPAPFLLPKPCVTQWVKERRWSSGQEGSHPPALARRHKAPMGP